MWTCPNCGTENIEEARFCVGCGQPKPEGPTLLAGAEDWQPLPQRQPIPLGEPEKRRSIWPWLAVLLALLLTAAVLIMLLLMRKPHPEPAPRPTAPSPTEIDVVTPEPSESQGTERLVTPTPAPTPKPTPTPSPTPSPTPAPAGEDLGLYLPAVERAMEESKDFSQWDGTFAGGMLYDVNGDGSRELILLYPGYVGESNVEAVYSVYTLRDGKAENVIPRTGMGGLAVNPGFYAGVVRMEGENYLIFTMTNGDQQDDMERHTLYRAKDDSLAYESYWSKDRETGAVICSINGKACSQEEYDRFLGGMKKLAYAGSMPYGTTEQDAEALVRGLDCYGLLWPEGGKDGRLFHGDVMEWDALYALLSAAPGQPDDEDAAIVTDAAQVGETGLHQLCDTMDDVIAENVRTSWNAAEHLNGSEYVGFYLLAAKDENARPRNILVLVYRNDVSVVISAEKVNKSLRYYYTLGFENVKLRPDGSLVLGAYEKPGERVNANIPRHNFYYMGYETLDGVYKAQVRPYEGSYTVTRAGDLP